MPERREITQASGSCQPILKVKSSLVGATRGGRCRGLEADEPLEASARLLVPGAAILEGGEGLAQDVRVVHLDRVDEATDQRGVEPVVDGTLGKVADLDLQSTGIVETVAFREPNRFLFMLD